MSSEKFDCPLCDEPGMSWIAFGSMNRNVLGKDYGDHSHPHQCMASSSISGLIVREQPTSADGLSRNRGIDQREAHD